MTSVSLRPHVQASLLILVLLLTGACEAPATKSPNGQSGAVIIETMDSGGYTYVKVAEGDDAEWYAVPECEVSVGDRVEMATGALEMRDFESKTLRRTFPRIFFAMSLKKIPPKGN